MLRFCKYIYFDLQEDYFERQRALKRSSNNSKYYFRKRSDGILNGGEFNSRNKLFQKVTSYKINRSIKCANVVRYLDKVADEYV